MAQSGRRLPATMQTPAHAEQCGLFISFEGPEGAGKTTQIELLARRLRAAGHAVHTTREPGGTPLGEQLRAVLLDPSVSDRDPVIEALLMMASRRDHLQQVILPQLATGAVVITDRYVDSTYAYQGYGSGVDRQWIAATMGLVTDELLPTLTVLLDLDPAVGLARKYRLFGGDETVSSFERRALAYHQRVRDGFRELAHAGPERWLVLDATQPVTQVGERIWERIEPLVPGRAAPGRAESVSGRSGA